MTQPSASREQKYATERFLRRKFNDSPTIKQMKWVRYLWLLGVEWGAIRNIYNLNDTTLLAILKMPEDWEANAA